MSSKVKKFASKNYPNLFRYPARSPNWVFRKYSAEKGKEFTHSTGESKNESRAYRIGLDAFNEWMGKNSAQDDVPLLGKYARRILDKKLALPDEVFSVGSKEITELSYGYIIKHFGHLRLDQMTETRWESHYTGALALKRQAFFNRRKSLVEIMLRAQREGLIRSMPKFVNPDAAPEIGEYLEDEWVTRLMNEATSDGQGLFYRILWRQGARPGEVLQYQWSMIHWGEGEHGFIHIPGPITKTRRARAIPLNAQVSALLKERQANSNSSFVFPGRDNPETHQVDYKTAWHGAIRRAAASIGKEIESASGVRAIQHLKEGQRKILNSSIYVLRGTFITNCLDQGFSSTFIGKYCDTSSKMIDSRYARRKQSAMEAIANVGGGV